jgi:DNA-binding NarL/FixJ family response regulator
VSAAKTGTGSPGSGHGSTATQPRGRVIVADDDKILREGLAHLLTGSGFEVVGKASDGSRLMELVLQLGPNLVVVDNRMPPTWTTEGLETARQISKQFPSVGTLVLSGSVEVYHALELLCGADRVGYLLKTQVTDVGRLVAALEQISLGESVIDPSLVRELVAPFHGDPLTSLTSAEHAVLSLMAQGGSNARIAGALRIHEDEVRSHADRVFTKLRLPESTTDRHRVLAILAFLDSR